MLSNADTPFIRQLYTGFTIRQVNARRVVNCDGAKRRLICEILVLSYQ